MINANSFLFFLIQGEGDCYIAPPQNLLQFLSRDPFDMSQAGKAPGVGGVIDYKGIAQIEDQVSSLCGDGLVVGGQTEGKMCIRDSCMVT